MEWFTNCELKKSPRQSCVKNDRPVAIPVLLEMLIMLVGQKYIRNVLFGVITQMCKKYSVTM